jgi:hypothetical protein
MGRTLKGHEAGNGFAKEETGQHKKSSATTKKQLEKEQQVLIMQEQQPQQEEKRRIQNNGPTNSLQSNFHKLEDVGMEDRRESRG